MRKRRTARRGSGPKRTKCRQIPPKRQLYTAKSKQVNVIRRKMEGQSNRRFAIEEGLDRETVARILGQQEVREKMAEASSILFAALPQAAKILVDRIERKKDSGVAYDVLYGMQVLRPKTGHMLEIHKDEFAGRSAEEKLFYAKHGHWPEESPHPKCEECKAKRK